MKPLPEYITDLYNSSRLVEILEYIEFTSKVIKRTKFGQQDTVNGMELAQVINEWAAV